MIFNHLYNAPYHIKSFKTINMDSVNLHIPSRTGDVNYRYTISQPK